MLLVSLANRLLTDATARDLKPERWTIRPDLLDGLQEQLHRDGALISGKSGRPPLFFGAPYDVAYPAGRVMLELKTDWGTTLSA